ncbi:enoyl-ACP reductase [Buchnera aphidicola (Mollitrichosiphum nigrofasciatum)]|uniref:enoyl-ACP reductase FabI n=1 Tax=Buchnera aphidicola TaxID=9 RepID=UPI0031B88B9D
MSFLKGKKILILGMANKYSIGYGIAKAMYQQGADLAFTYQNLKYKKRVIKLANNFNSNIIFPCDVSSDNNIINLFSNLSIIWKKFDGFVHAIAYTPISQLQNNYIDCITKKIFNMTHVITSYSLVSMIKACKNMLNKKSSIITISFIGANIIIPYYNIMGLAKASLEANVRYSANILGKDNIRINGISPAPIKTLASFKIKNFNKLFNDSKKKNILKRNITIHEIGNVAAFLCSDLSSGITGQIIYVDGGYNLMY